MPQPSFHLPDKISILCASDDNYAPYCGIMLTSLLENNRDREVTIYILIGKPFSAKNQRRFKRLSDKYGADIVFVTVDNSFFDKFPVMVDHLSVAAYYRLCAGDLMPKDVSKVLYLDCDIIVERPIGDLFDMEWDGYAVGAVHDVSSGQPAIFDWLGYDISAGYFNSGSLFMNLDYWRANEIGQNCFDFLSSHYDHLHFADQCVLNGVVWNCKKNLPVTYNFQIQFRDPWFFNTLTEEIKKDVLKTDSPHIIHYTGYLKPWMICYYAFPYNKEWHKYKRKSPWRFMMDKLPKEKPFRTFVKRYFLWPFGIMVHGPASILTDQN